MEEELLRVENELTIVLRKLSIEPNIENRSPVSKGVTKKE